jgi:hypothetical protein
LGWEFRGRSKKTSATVGPLEPFAALDPFFGVIEKGLEGLADGGHFFDLLAAVSA